MTDEVLFADNLSPMPGMAHAFFTKEWGQNYFSERQADQDARTDRDRMAGHFGLSSAQLQFCHQVHSAKVLTVKGPLNPEAVPDADGMVTDRSHTALGILSAD